MIEVTWQYILFQILGNAKGETGAAIPGRHTFRTRLTREEYVLDTGFYAMEGKE